MGEQMIPVYVLGPLGIDRFGIVPDDFEEVCKVERLCREHGGALVWEDGTHVVPQHWNV